VDTSTGNYRKQRHPYASVLVPIEAPLANALRAEAAAGRTHLGSASWPCRPPKASKTRSGEGWQPADDWKEIRLDGGVTNAAQDGILPHKPASSRER
jgi:hypothetical protein